MEENKKDYSDFFKSQDDSANDNKDSRREADPERPYYYSYGPYKSAPQPEGDSESAASYQSLDHSESVEVTAPKPVRPYPYGVQEPQAPAAPSGWTPAPAAPKRRSNVRGMFAAFMAGAVLVGSLMFASDRMNLFTGTATGGSGSASAPANVSSGSGSSAGVKSAALDISRPGSVSSIVQQASPAVVKIESFVTVKQRTRSNSLMDDPFFQYFFGNGNNGGNSQSQPKAGTKQQAGMGTGFIFEKSGYILTNQHVIEGAEEIQVTVEGYDEPFVAKLLGNSAELDLAVLKIEGTKDFPILPIGDSNSMSIGDWVVAIGNPYGFEHTVTVGVLSAKEREIEIPETTGTRTYKHLFQTDASINPGNSGGPLLNLNGEVVGINTAVNAQAQGIGFAIPTSTISEVLESLKNNVQIPKAPVPYIGATLSSLKDVDASYLKELKIDGTDGVMVVSVELGHPAFKAGLKTYDVITSIDGAAVKTKEELITKIQAKKVGDKASFGILRDGQKAAVDITIGNKNDFAQKQQ
ncbi:S1C family serine protease [Gorillibacterium sp. sgz5001074]|uniref:S1C family serine protease n=1 Tax=Gorillibacterium sp. sgz5001074 TaxID=3446695 RepID=UPI003F678F02